MKYNKLGINELKVSEISLGTMNFGGKISNTININEKDSFSLLDEATENGINFIDTSDVYNMGDSEKIIGRWIKDKKNRHNVIIGTKFGYVKSQQWNNKNTKEYINNCLNNSLRRLKTDYIDLYQIHIENKLIDEQLIIETLEELKKKGKILNYGASNYSAFKLRKNKKLASLNNYQGYSSLQAKYNLLSRNIENEHIDTIQEEKISLLVWSPLAGGILTGKYNKGLPLESHSRYNVRKDMFYEEFDNKRTWSIINKLNKLSRELKVPLNILSLAWLLKKQYITSVIIGASNKKQLLENLKSSDFNLSFLNEIDLDTLSFSSYGYPYDSINKYKQRNIND